MASDLKVGDEVWVKARVTGKDAGVSPELLDNGKPHPRAKQGSFVHIELAGIGANNKVTMPEGLVRGIDALADGHIAARSAAAAAAEEAEARRTGKPSRAQKEPVAADAGV